MGLTKRRRARLEALVALPAVLLAVSCGRPDSTSATLTGPRLVPSPTALARLGVPIHAIVDHRFSSPVRVDGGALAVSPPGSASVGVPLRAAEETTLVAMVNQGASFNPALLGVGRVSVAAPGPGGLPTYRNRLAWVGFIAPGAAAPSCAPGSGSPNVDAPSFEAVILDATTGKASLVFRSRGTGACGGPVSGPSVNRAYEVRSVPWRAVSLVDAPRPPGPSPPGVTYPTGPQQWLVRFTVPRCGSSWDQGAVHRGRSSATWYVEVQRPIDPPAHCPPARQVSGPLPPGAPLRHAPVGVVIDGRIERAPGR